MSKLLSFITPRVLVGPSEIGPSSIFTKVVTVRKCVAATHQAAGLAVAVCCVHSGTKETLNSVPRVCPSFISGVL